MILIRMGNITDRLVSSCARSIVSFDIGLQEVCAPVGGRTLPYNQIFLGWIVYQILLPMVLRFARKSYAFKKEHC